ncbi:MAG: phosphatase PAP2 family protein [Nocardioidaceae bacterium]|nr:MAG: phosphatase PAP2 family protein [Nocardioidaceae bacterium]
MADVASGSRERTLANTLTSPRVLELVALAVLAVAYNVIRAQAGNDVAAAFQNAADIIRIEGPIFDKIEIPLNQAMATMPLIAVPACYFYAVLHYLVTPTILFISWKRGGIAYRRGYWTLILASAIGLAIYATYPLAPPRLMTGMGTIDVMREFSHYGWWGGAASAPTAIGDATNQFAAMPSLHCGWAIWCGIQMWGFGGRIWKTLAIAYPALQVYVVIATANHYLLDVMGGAAVVLVGLVIVLSWERWLAPAKEKSRTPA